jgi:PBSX family phage terminase large subunit
LKLHHRQIDAIRLLKKHRNVLLFGGSRSGKTFVAIDFLIHAAYKFGCRFLVARRFGTDVREGVWNITIPDVLSKRGYVLGLDYRMNDTRMTLTVAGGGTVHCIGLDDKERVDKALSTEYAGIYVTEATDVPFSTVTLLKTRLSQIVEGFTNIFMADLNPGSDAHWTNKLWIQNIHPQTREPLKNPDNYAYIWMSPYDNQENLAPGYIEENLESLVGNERQRFLDGKYQNTSGLKVFNPVGLYSWPEFLEWAASRQGSLKFVAGLDLGYQDADAFVIFAYVPDESEVWLIFEHKARRETLEELVSAIRGGMAWVRANVPARDHDLLIYSETATLRYGHEGDNKKTASDLANTYGLPIRPAYKRDKKLGIELLQDEVNSGRFKIPRGGSFHDETDQIVWTRLTDGTIERKIDDESYHADEMDAVLYPYREIRTYGGDEHRQIPAPEAIPQGPPPNIGDMMYDKFMDRFRHDNARDVW